MRFKADKNMSMETLIVPKHVGIIPDGNRRFAKRLMKQPWNGHKWGSQKIKNVFDWCKELGINTITVYALSLENIDKRPRKEIEFLYRLAKKELVDLVKENGLAHRNKIKVKVFGRLDLIPEDLREIIRDAEEKTKNYTSYNFNLAIAYGGRQEILNACKEIAIKVKRGDLRMEDITEDLFKESLYMKDEPDLIIRTGMEKRFSNFLPFQAAYSEFVFLDVFWPELSKRDFKEAIMSFSGRQRRFGK